jgi:hypothetical protein
MAFHVVILLVVVVVVVAAGVRFERATRRFSAPLVLLLLFIGAAALGGLYLLAVTARPPMPLKLGRLVWDYECGFTVDRVERKDVVQRGLRIAHARGTFYVVHARVVCPFGERYRWDSSRAYVVSEATPWPPTRYAPDPSAQAIVDARAGTSHTVLGARELATLAFDLPIDIPQPALIFTDTIGFNAFLDNVRVGRLYMPHRFNLRYD